MTLTLQFSPDQTHIDCFARQLHVPSTRHQLSYAGPVGELTVRGHYFPNNLALYSYQSTTRQPITFHTVNPANSGLYCLFINLSDEALDKQIGETTVHLSQHSPNGIFYYGPDLRISQQIEVGIPFTAVALVFSAHTLRPLLPDVPLDALLPQPSGFVFMDLDTDTERLLRGLLSPAEPGSLTELRYYGQCVEFLSRVFERMRHRETNANTAGLLQPDIEKLFAARRMLLDNLAQPPTQPLLAQAVGLSEATLRRYFPRLFGTSIYQYVQAARMAKAHELLATRQFSVSEVGFRVGYTNLTHFTNAYRKHFGQNPSEYLRSVTSSG
jgi:AraC-like DNA-binding protein